MNRLLCLIASLLLLPACSSTAQMAQMAPGDPSYPDAFAEPIVLYPESALGTISRPITTSSEKAQAYYDQGFQMMYAFAKEDASRSFREARLADPECAACYWAEAWSWGSYLNGPMPEADAPRAYWAIQEARELRDTASPREQALIDAMSVRYVEDFDPEQRREQDSLYALAMEDVVNQYPDDLDIATLWAESLFLLQPRRGTRDLNDPDVQRLHGVLEGILERDIRHAGACHLYIHATESTDAPELAEPCAEYIGDAIPGASHINHMPSHTWNQIGRWGDAVRSNVQAWHSDMKADVDEGFAIYPSHNLHMLLFAASMDGQGAVAIQAGRDYAELTGNPMYHAMTLIRFGRFDQLDDVDPRPQGDVAAGLWDFSMGYAALRKGDAEFAQAYLTRLTALADTSSGRFRFHPAKHLLNTAVGILDGEIRRERGDLEGALDRFAFAVAAYDSLEYDEPEPFPFSPRHWYGNALNEAGDFAKAEEAFLADLDSHPHNGWSLFGLIRAIEGQGREVPAEVREDFEASWSRSDTWIRGPVF